MYNKGSELPDGLPERFLLDGTAEPKDMLAMIPGDTYRSKANCIALSSRRL